MMLANNYSSDMNVMGQTITFDENTVFTSHVKGVESIYDITEISALEVSGYTTGSGSFYATHIIVNISDAVTQDVLRVRGVVDALGNNSFRIGKIDVHFNDDTTFVNIENNQVTAGMVIVMGGSFVDNNATSVRLFNATSLEAIYQAAVISDPIEA